MSVTTTTAAAPARSRRERSDPASSTCAAAPTTIHIASCVTPCTSAVTADPTISGLVVDRRHVAVPGRWAPGCHGDRSPGSVTVSAAVRPLATTAATAATSIAATTGAGHYHREDYMTTPTVSIDRHGREWVYLAIATDPILSGWEGPPTSGPPR